MGSASLVIILAAAAVLPILLALAPWLPLPGPLVELLVGYVLGAQALGWVEVDSTVRAIAGLGLSMLLFLAGYEVDLRRFRGQMGAAAGVGLLLSLMLAAVAGLLAANLLDLRAGAALVAVALLATSLGLVVPVLKDARLLDRPVGRLVVAGSSVGELAAVVLLSVGFAAGGSSTSARLLLLGLLLLAVVAVALVAVAAARSPNWQVLVGRLADTTAQIRVRLTVLLVAALALAAERLGFEAVLGAFLAGLLVRLVDVDPDRTHPRYPVKLEALGFGFLVPVFFVASGAALDLKALLDEPQAVGLTLALVVLLLVVRGVPALAYRRLVSGREMAGAALLQASSLPFLVVVAEIGRDLALLDDAQAAALVAAGLVSVVLFPAAALRVLADRPGRRPSPGTADWRWPTMDDPMPTRHVDGAAGEAGR